MRRAIAVSIVMMSTVAQAGEPSPPAADAKLVGHVVVWADARWYASPDHKGPSAQLTDYGKEGRTQVHGHGVAAKVVGTSGDFVEVEPLQRASDCAWWRFTAEPAVANLRLFVKRADIAPVLVKRFTKRAKDGSFLTIEPGVQLVPTDADSYVVSINGDRVVAKVPDSSVGHTYKAPRPFKRATRGLRYTFGTLGIGRLIDEDFTVSYAFETYAAAVKKRGKEHVLFPLSAPCIAGAFVTAKDAVIEQKPTWDPPSPLPRPTKLKECTDVIFSYTRIDAVAPDYAMNEPARRTLKLCP